MGTFREDTKLGTKVPQLKTDDYNDYSVTEKKLEKSLANKINKADSISKEFDKFRDNINESEQARAEAEASRKEAESLRVSAEKQRETASKQAVSAVNDAVNSAIDTAEHPTIIREDHYVYEWNKATKSYDKTDIYVKGDPMTIVKDFSSIAEMQEYKGSDVKVGDLVIICSTTEDEDNAKLFVKKASGWQFIVDLSGFRGFEGKTPQLSIGTVTTLPSGSQAEASLSPNGTDTNGNPKFKLNISIPKGDKMTLAGLSKSEIAELQKPATDAVAKCETAASNANSAALSANTAANNANTLTDTVQKATATALKAATTANEMSEAVKADEQKRVDAENARISAENIRKANETTRQDAENARISAEKKRTNDVSVALNNCNSAVSNCNTAASAANTSAKSSDAQTEKCKTQTDLAQELNNNPLKLGSDKKWLKYNPTSKEYVSTGISSIGYSDKGNWQQGYSFVDSESGETITGYDQNDLVHTDDGIFRSLIDGNSTQPGTESETWQVWVDVTPVSDTVSKVNALISAFQNSNPFCGFARVSGDSDPNALTDYTYGSSTLMHNLFKHVRLAWVKDGKVKYICAPGRISKATDGTDIAIDGTMGDLMVYFEDGANFLTATQQVNDQQLNMMALGAVPCYWQDKASEHIKPFAITADYTVHAKIGDDVRSQAHCCYNKSVNGSWNAPNGLFKASYLTSAGGVNMGGISCVSSIQNAQNKNTDPLTNRPYMGEYYRFYEVWAAMAMIECGTLAISRLNLFGAGLTPLDTVNASTFYDTQMSGNSGYKVILSGGSVKYYNIHGYQEFMKGSSTTLLSLQNGINNYSYGICECLEVHRVLDGVKKAGLVGKIGDSTAFFVMDADGSVSLCSDDIDVTTGSGMEACKHYYQVRDVPNCEGMADGVMTAVVNSYTKMEFADDAKLKDGTSLTDAITIMKRSQPIYRGKGLPYRGRFEQLSGMHYIINKNADGTEFWQFKCAENVDDVQPLAVFNNTAYEGSLDAELPIEKGLSYESRPSFSMSWNEGNVSNADYNHSLFEFTKAGGSIRTNECVSLWLYPGNNAGNGKRQVHGSVVGCFAFTWGPQASLRSANCSHNAGHGDYYYGGAFAVPNIDSDK